jgi:phosphatidylserine/phosphatidylglycerophosphate/cardiolipin synthase-like enzyme
MRAAAKQGGLVGLAVAGTYVVLLGWDLEDPGLKRGLLGFAIKREDKTETETYWLRGMKTFPDTEPPLPPGGDASSHDQPYQTFQWADYSAKPDHHYVYTIIAMQGSPGALQDGPSISLDVSTEAEWSTDAGSPHSVFFNRAAIASQEYARRFQNKSPDDVGQPAFDWLSRGLAESIVAYIESAKDGGYGLRAAIYEFQLPVFLNALRAAADRGVDVQIAFDAIENAAREPVDPNEEAVAAAKLGRLCTRVTHGKIMHNKFIVLTKAGKPVSVLTGSTNFTESAVYGQLNVAHIVADPVVAQAYLDYWTEISGDPELAELRGWAGQETPDPTNPPDAGVVEVFSPRKGLSALQAYGDIAAGASEALFMTFAFGINDVFAPTYLKQDGVLRFALLDKEGSGRGAAKGRKTVADMRDVPNTVVAVGKNIVANEFDRWVKELAGLSESKFVRWVHTKFMLSDPLSSDPIVITGSANFSNASTEENHENMIVIRGDTRIADIYLGEFMRQFSSYAFRDAAAAATKKTGDAPEDWKPQDLAADDSWVADYFKAGGSRALRRVYFSGGTAAANTSASVRGKGKKNGADKDHDHPTRGKAGGRRSR